MNSSLPFCMKFAMNSQSLTRTLMYVYAASCSLAEKYIVIQSKNIDWWKCGLTIKYPRIHTFLQVHCTLFVSFILLLHFYGISIYNYFLRLHGNYLICDLYLKKDITCCCLFFFFFPFFCSFVYFKL